MVKLTEMRVQPNGTRTVESVVGRHEPHLERDAKETVCGTLSKAYGYGGATVVHELTGLALNTIRRGKKELSCGFESAPRRIRGPGGGPKWSEEKYPDIQEHIRKIVEGSTNGNPEKILSWTTDSLRDIGRKLSEGYGEQITYVTAGSILEAMGYSRQVNQKMLQVGERHPDRNAQFEFINTKAGEFIKAGEPVISVDTKKKENIGNFKNPGTEYRRGEECLTTIFR
jgi:hypothetical protein